MSRFLLEHKESVIALWGGFCLGLLACYAFTWNRNSKLSISKENLDDLKDRMDHIDSFVFDSKDLNLITKCEHWQNSRIQDRKSNFLVWS